MQTCGHVKRRYEEAVDKEHHDELIPEARAIETGAPWRTEGIDGLSAEAARIQRLHTWGRGRLGVGDLQDAVADLLLQHELGIEGHLDQHVIEGELAALGDTDDPARTQQVNE